MADSLLTTLYGMLDKRSITGVADSLGVSEQSATQGLKSAIPALLGGIASKSKDPNSLRTLLDLAPKALCDDPLLQAARGITDPNSPLIAGGRHILASLFGNSEAAVTNTVGAASGLRAGSASMLLAMAAPSVMSFIANHARMEGMNMRSLANFLQRETTSIRSALPAGLNDLLWLPAARTVSPVVAQSVERERSSLIWPPVLALTLLIPGLIWLFGHLHTVAVPAVAPITPVTKPMGAASRAVVDPVGTVRLALHNIEFYFDTGSAKLQPESQEQLDHIAATLLSCPGVHLTINGHTDNVGPLEHNLHLSQRRANAVMAELIRKRIPADHMTATGNGQQDPINDNSTKDGRAENRRVSLEFSEH